MALRDFCNIILIWILAASFTYAQVTEVRCINPEFDVLIDDYLDYSVPVISVADAYDAKENFIFLDAREIEEFEISHLDGAVHIGYDDFNIEKLASTVPKAASIIVYCSIGYRSEKIGKLLKKNGFQSVQNLYGSIFEWVNQHHPVFDMNGKQTLQVHAYNRRWSKWLEDEDIKKVW